MIPFLLSIFIIYTTYGAEDSGVFQGDLQEKLLENTEVKTAFDLCKSKNICPNYDCSLSSNPHYNSFDDCVWNNLSKSTQDNLSDVFAKQNKTSTAAPAVLPQHDDPAIKKLHDYLSKRLEEALYGAVKEEGNKRKRVVNHITFIHLYESQVSKNVILALSSYCLDAYSDNNTTQDEYKYLIPASENKVKDNRKKNIDKLSQFHTDDDNNAVKTSTRAKTHWKGCIQAVQHICHKNSSKYTELAKLDDTPIDLKDESSSYKSLIDNSSKRACAVNDYIKKSRSKLLYLAEVKNIYEKVQKKSRNITDSNPEFYSGRGDQKSIDEITTLSSNELINTSGFKSENEQMVKEFKNNCDPDKTHKDQRSDAECAKYISKNKEEHEKALDEYRIRSLATQKKIEKIKDKKEVVEYLKQEGYGEEKIKKLTNDQNIESIKKQIRDHYTQERKQIIQTLTDKIKNRSVKKAERASDASGIDEIYNELKQRSEHYEQLVHFNNIVSGYLTISNSESDKITRNTKSIEIEISDSAIGKTDQDQSKHNEDKARITESLNALKKDSEEQKEGSTNTLGVDTINSAILNYEIPEDTQNNP